ncbi:unnamed protein product [Cylicocyclus nassatus]|uniref:Abnormal cell migration protein 18-like fibronectin type I domain-containing protein n=1 Tax=Cylicocyclus nassatus TaxID=53992 RepID=A0AA36GJ64_CYLNA|nr:unnamed protein product [Cylicocyclus nassatus]
MLRLSCWPFGLFSRFSFLAAHNKLRSPSVMRPPLLACVLVGISVQYACSCIHKGKVFEDGQEWSDGRYIRKCKLVPERWDYDIVACIIGGERVNIGRTIKVKGPKGTREYLCDHSPSGKAYIRRIF